MISHPQLTGLVLGAGLFVALCAAGCSSPSVPPYDRQALLSEAAEMMSSRYADVHEASETLQTATQTLCDAPSADELAATKKAYKRVFLNWQRTLAYRLGPSDDQNFGAEMSFAPTNPDKIEANIAGDDKLTADLIESEGGATKGLFALEYLLYAQSDADTATVLQDKRRCDYLLLLGDHVEKTSQLLAQAWDPDGGNFEGTLKTAGSSENTTYPAELSAISALLTGLVSAIDVMKAQKLGQALGHLDDSAPKLVESPYAHLSKDALLANMDGARELWTGKEHNFDEYLKTRDQALAQRVVTELSAASSAIKDIPSTLAEYVAGDDLSVGEVAYTALGDLEHSLALDVSTTLAVSLGFNSNDGD